MARHIVSSHGDAPIVLQTWFSLLNAYASTGIPVAIGVLAAVIVAALCLVVLSDCFAAVPVFFLYCLRVYLRSLPLLFSFFSFPSSVAVVFFLRSLFGTVSCICGSGLRTRATLLRPMATPRSSSMRGFLI